MAESIFSRKHHIEEARRIKQREAMNEYDETVYYPALKALRTECAAVGHYPNGRWQFMVSGAPYQYCGHCSITLSEEEVEAIRRVDREAAK